MAIKKADTVAGLVEATGCTRQHINRVCRQLFGPAAGYRRKFSDEEIERLRKVFLQPGRRKRFKDSLELGQSVASR